MPNNIDYRQKVLITGASGLIGSPLTELLIKKGHSVAHLGRAKSNGVIPSFIWNLSKGRIDTRCLSGIDTIVHLAGANIAERRWTASRKREIAGSRIKSTALLVEALKNNSHTVKAFISASAIGYYGFAETDKVFREDDKPGEDFLARVTTEWEAEVDKLQGLGMRVSKIRTGIVLSRGGGALSAMAKPIQWGVGAPLGSGRQFLSWIHIDDLCGIFAKAIEDRKMNGPYNATASWCTNGEMTDAIAKVLKKNLWLPPVPSFVLKMILGEMADVVLNGSKASCEKIKQTGYLYKFAAL